MPTLTELQHHSCHQVGRTVSFPASLVRLTHLLGEYATDTTVTVTMWTGHLQGCVQHNGYYCISPRILHGPLAVSAKPYKQSIQDQASNKFHLSLSLCIAPCVNYATPRYATALLALFLVFGYLSQRKRLERNRGKEKNTKR